MAGPCANSNIGVVTLAPSQRRFPPPWTIRDLLHGLLIALTFPGHLIWELAKYCNSQEGRLGKIGMFAVLSPMFGFSALVWFGALGSDCWGCFGERPFE